jgi:AsmA protein
MLSDSIQLFPKGTIGLDGTLNLGLETRLNTELSTQMDSQGSITMDLSDNDGWTRLPLSLKGSYNSPVFGLNAKGLPEQASKDLGSELRRKIDAFFKQPESSPQATGKINPEKDTLPASDPASKALQDSLQKLFGH